MTLGLSAPRVRRGWWAVTLVVIVGVGATGLPAEAKTTTKAPKHNLPGANVRYPPKVLAFYQGVVSKTVTTRSGHRVSATAKLSPGDRVKTTYKEYTGNHTQHAATATGSAALGCTFTSTTEAVCTGLLSVGGSSVLMTKVPVDFGVRPTEIAVTGGTGSFSHYHGLITQTRIEGSSNADIVVVVSPKPTAKS